MALTIQATETNVTEMRSDAYRRHVSQAQEYLASPPAEPDTPSF